MIFTLCLQIIIKTKTDYPPFYAINFDEDSDIYTLFEQDNCDPKLYQSREKKSTYLFPDPEISDQWLIKNDTIESFKDDGCKHVNYGKVVYKLKDQSGILSQNSRLYVEIIGLDFCQKYHLSKAGPELDSKAKAANKIELSNLFGENGELNKDNENKNIFFLQYSINNHYYEVYSSEKMAFLRQKSKNETNFIE